jgi:hypothetical protein
VNAKINTYKLPGVTESMFVVAKNLESDLSNGNCNGISCRAEKITPEKIFEERNLNLFLIFVQRN